MKYLTNLAAFASMAVASVMPSSTFDLVQREALPQADPSCSNGPDTRACWTDGYSIATDFDQKHPTTGVTRPYNLEITNGTCNPDGASPGRVCFLVNGQFPGPVIEANWGDYLSITVKNSMENNGTGIHWHGVRQLNSNYADGVNGITQCPIAPGQSYTYNFQVTQYGTSWYHSHFSNQYGDGALGPLVFHGPASANYDIDLGTYQIQDWYYQTAFQIAALTSDNLQAHAGPPNADNILINGTNKNAQGGGKYNYVSVTKGKKYRLRLVSTSVDNYITVSLDGHPFEVITTDFVPVKPFTAETLTMAIGQRYDVIITANQTAGNYWFRANANTACNSTNNFYGRAVWTYEGVDVADPTSTPFAQPNDCVEPLPAPYWNQPVPQASFDGNLNISLTGAQVVPGEGVITVWALDGTSLNVDWKDPTFSYLYEKNTSYPPQLDVINAAAEGDWNYWLIQQSERIPQIAHPIHLHGHDFFVLGQGTSQFTGSETLNWQNPTRRDTSTAYAGGWVAIAFLSNNPGAWLMHCHISWHISEGFGLQYVEGNDQVTFPDMTTYNNICSGWDSYTKGEVYIKDDSGL